MVIQQQLMFLLQRKLIDEDIVQWVLDVQDHALSQWKINLECNQTLMFFTHLAMALGRIKRGYCVQPIAEDILLEMKHAAVFPRIFQCHSELLALLPIVIPESEQSHIMVNIYSLSLEQPQILENK